MRVLSTGQGQFGERDIVEQSEEYVACAKEHSVNFAPPRLLFSFYNGITAAIASELRCLGVYVCGNIVNNGGGVDDVVHIKHELSKEEQQPIHDGIAHVTDLYVTPEQRATHNDTLDTYKTDTTGFDLNVSERVKLGHISSFDRHTNKDKCDRKDSKGDSEDLGFVSHTTKHHTDSGGYTEKNTCQVESLDVISDQTEHQRNQDIDLSSNVASHVSGVCPLTKHIEIHGSHISRETPSHRSTNDQLKTSCAFAEEIPDMHGAKRPDCLSNYSHAIAEGNVDYNLRTWSMGDISVLSFIETELLLKPLVDYSIIGVILADNKINFVANIQNINLDVTALITLVSSVSHGCCYFRFRENVLSEQATEERCDPVLPKLNEFLDGRLAF